MPSWPHLNTDHAEPVYALLTFLAVTAAAYPAGARLDELAAASRVALTLSFAFHAPAVALALVGMYRVRAAGTEWDRRKRVTRWLKIAAAFGAVSWAVTSLV